MSVGKPRLLMVGHMYATAFNRRKLNPLADDFEVTCVTWELNETKLFGLPLAEFEKEDHEPRYELVRLPVWPRRAGITRYVHEGLSRVMREKAYDVVLVDSEPWGLIRWQVWAMTRMMQPWAMFGEFTWENIERRGLKGGVLSVIYRLAAWTHDFSISGNQACRAILLKHGARAETNLVAAQLGVESADFRPATAAEKATLRVKLGVAKEGFLVGFCGRLNAEKGIRELLAAVEEVRARMPERDVRLALLGHGLMDDELKAMRAEKRWLDVLAPRPHREVAEFMRSLDLFVLASKPVHRGPSVWEEQFGHVLIEAMAARVATLGSTSGAIPEVIGMAEAVFAHSDAKALAEMMARWVRDDEGRERLAEAQRQRTLANYTHEALGRTWSDFLLKNLEKIRAVS